MFEVELNHRARGESVFELTGCSKTLPEVHAEHDSVFHLEAWETEDRLLVEGVGGEFGVAGHLAGLGGGVW